MMKTNNEVERDFESVAYEFLEEREQQHGDTLGRYIEMYPAYADALMMLAMEIAAADDEEVAAETPPTALRERLRASARGVFVPKVAVLTSLLDRAREHAGLDEDAFAERIELGPDVVMMLEERAFPPESIYPAAIDLLAGVLDLPSEAVRDFFRGPLRGGEAVAAYHKIPEDATMRPRTFTEAITESPFMSAEQKARWMARAPQSEPKRSRTHRTTKKGTAAHAPLV